MARSAAAAWLALTVSSGLALADGEAAAPAPRTVTVGVPPASTAWGGFDRDLFAALARDIGADVAWVEVAQDGALAGLGAGRFDVAAGPFAPTETPRLLRLPPVAERGDALLKRRGDGAVTMPADIAGKAVGVVPGSGEAARVRAAVAALHGRMAARPVVLVGQAEADLAAGRLAALAGPLDAVAAAATARPALFEVVGPPFGPAVRVASALRQGPETAPLAADLAAAIGRMRADGRLAALQRRWFGLAFDPPDAAPLVAPHPPAAPEAPGSSTSNP